MKQGRFFEIKNWKKSPVNNMGLTPANSVKSMLLEIAKISQKFPKK